MSKRRQTRWARSAGKPGRPSEVSARRARAEERIEIVPAKPADADAAAAITREAFKGVSIDQAIQKALGRAAANWQDIKSREVRTELERTPQNCFVAKLDGRTVGYVTTRVDAYASRGQIANLAVEASCRGRGVGRQLLQRALEHFRSLGLKQAKIETLVTNPIGQHLYPEVGFREVVRQIHYAMRL